MEVAKVNMIEKVARALYPNAFERGGVFIAHAENKARAAIEAMREPTDEMIVAAVNATEEVDWVRGLFGGSYDNATQVFSDSHKAMIDAALSEPSQTGEK